MHRSATRILEILLLGVLASLSNLASAEIYKWVDAQGNIHFSDKPGDAQAADNAEKVDVIESYQPAARTPQEQQTFDEQQRKTRLRDEMRMRDDAKAKAEAKMQRDKAREATCVAYSNEIDELETVKVKNGVRYITYATDDEGNALTSQQQRERVAQLKEQRAKAGCK